MSSEVLPGGPLRRARSQQINLVDPSLLRVRERLTGTTLLTLMVAGVVLVGLHYAVAKYELQRQMASLAARSPEPVPTGTETLPAGLMHKQEQLAREETLREALNRGGDLPQNTGALLTSVAQALPDAVWLTELQILGEKALVISGGTLERPALTAFSRQLEASPALHGTPIGVVQLEPRNGSGENTPGGGTGTLDGGSGADLPTAQGATHFAFTLASRTSNPNLNPSPGGRP